MIKMEKTKINLRFGVITIMILLAALSRIVPHPANFAPVGGMALFGAAYFGRRFWAFLIPLVSMWISDLILNNAVYGQYFDRFVWFYSGSLFTYAAFVFIVLFGMFALRRVSVLNLAVSALCASAIFFIVSNFGVWFSTEMYPKDFGGLIACYTAGIPFFKNTLLGDFVYTGTLFGAFEFGMRRFPQLQFQKQNYL